MAGRRSGGTRERLLAAASELFARKGFAGTTVAEVCAAAGSNIAAVNYHFGGKETLYQQSWRHSLAQSIAAHPQDGGVAADAPAEGRLRVELAAIVARFADPNSRDFRIALHELVRPTGLLDEVMRAEMGPLQASILAVLRELLGPEASEQQVVFCETCIVGMCVHSVLMSRARQRAGGESRSAPIDDPERFTSHLIEFALAGIAAMGKGRGT